MFDRNIKTKLNTIYLYVYLCVVAFFITSLSFLIEYIYPFIRDLNEMSKLFGLFWFRFSHFVVFLYFSGFLLFYNWFSWNEKMAYLGFALMMELSWDIYDYCPFTYYEFQMYEIENPTFKTTFHPSMYSIFREHSYPIVFLTGVIMVITTSFILYDLYKNFCRGSQFIARTIYIILYAVVFYTLIIRSVIKTKDRAITSINDAAAIDIAANPKRPKTNTEEEL